MGFDFDSAFSTALAAGVAAAQPGGKAAADWVRQSAKANEATLRAVAEGFMKGNISRETAEILLAESSRALESEAAALAAYHKAAAQAGVNAFLGSLRSAILTGLKLAI